MAWVEHGTAHRSGPTSRTVRGPAASLPSSSTPSWRPSSGPSSGPSSRPRPSGAGAGLRTSSRQDERAGRRDRRAAPPDRSRPRWQTPADGAAGRVVRLLLVVALWGTTTGGLGAVVSAAGRAVLASGPARVEDAVTVAAGGAALLAAWWLAMGVIATVLAGLLERRRPGGALARTVSGVARRAAPAGVRRATLLALGLTMAGVAAPALAADRPGRAAVPAVCATAAAPAACFDPSWAARPTADGTSRTATTGAHDVGQDRSPGLSLDPGWVPDAPPAAPVTLTAMPGPAPRARHVARAEVVVHRGDTLWSIVERHLGPRATAAEVAAEVPRWHAANLDVVGPDADVLLPGQLLRPPGSGTARDRVRPPAAPVTTGGAVGGAR